MGNISEQEASKWSLSQLENRLRGIESEYRHLEMKREALGREYDAHPERWQGYEPAGLSGWAKVLDRMDEDIALIKREISRKS